MMVTVKQVRAFHFTYGDFGWYADRYDGDDIWWDKEGDEPTEDDLIDSRDHWNREGWNDALRDEADQKYEASRDDY